MVLNTTARSDYDELDCIQQIKGVKYSIPVNSSDTMEGSIR